MEAATTASPTPEPEPRYRALQTVARIYRIIAWVILVVGGIAVVVAAIATGSADDGGGGDAILTLVVGTIGVALYALFAFAFAEMIGLAIAIEANTRRTAEAIGRSTAS